MVTVNGKSVAAHRYVWEQYRGPIPPGMVMDHQCRNRACCNVDHLRVVTRQQNVTENVVGTGWQIEAAKTHCPKGHPYDEKNTYRRSKKRCRECKICVKRRAKIQYRLKRMRAEIQIGIDRDKPPLLVLI